ncbi:hypothetical protein SAY87_006444 [Trapa incisa]|uniref:t-SNARE coiled-coil homology domain-containing protein n=1 Tax=Trapa incisa TaxID=236973 RepID=A0AAN7PYA8_9MYRT|nr:hypothetical protein SAY87_006444 [Trapa incisa]
MFGSKKSSMKKVVSHYAASSSNPFDSDDEHVASSWNPFDSDDEHVASSSNPFDSDDEHVASSSNPFDSDDEYDMGKHAVNTSTRNASSNQPPTGEFDSKNPFDHQETKGSCSSLPQNELSYARRNRYKNDFCGSGGFENQSIQELENYAVYKAKETTRDANNCVKIAEEIKDTATKILTKLDDERLLLISITISIRSLGCIWEKIGKPKKTRAIVGLEVVRDDDDDDVQRKGNRLQQREKLDPSTTQKKRPNSTSPSEPASSLQKIEDEKAKQDTLSVLSNILGDMKNLAIEMRSEIDRQTKAMEPFNDDVDELNYRVKQANERGGRLLKK